MRKNNYHLFFANPRQLPIQALEKTGGPLCAYDLGFGNNPGDNSYEKVTLPFLQKFEHRLLMWVDHHDHEMWPEWQNKPNFRLVPRAEAPSCPFIVEAGEFKECPVHVLDKDFDALATLIRACGGGYSEMLWDSLWAERRRITTFRGNTVKGFSPTGRLIESALKAHWNPQEGGNQIRRAVFDWLVFNDSQAKAAVQRGAKDYEPVLEQTKRHLKKVYVLDHVIAVCDLRQQQSFKRFDLTELLTRMREDCRFAVVVQKNQKGEFITIATNDDSINLIKIMEVSGGFSQRVTVEHLTLQQVLNRIQVLLP